MGKIDDFRQNFAGVKSNRFKITGGIPSSLSSQINSSAFNEALEIYCKATQFPGSSVGSINLNYRGRPVKFPAERSAADWAIQVYSSSLDSKDLRTLFQRWIDFINSGNHDKMNWKAYAGEWVVSYDDMFGSQSNSNYGKLCSLINVFPIDISPIELTNDATDVFAEFTVTLTYDYSVFYP
jgi:hypothetical protein